jgi:uncharacterized protein YbjT (DUF2867 family)
MKIVILGGTGLIGRRLGDHLTAAGHDVITASPSTGVNAVTGEGLTAAVSGADVVVDVPNAPSFEDGPVMDFFRASTSNLVTAEKEAGVQHHVVLSVVGADTLPDIGYMRAKTEQENIVRASGVPFTIVRATQFFEFIATLADAATVGDTVRLSPVLMQPIAAADVSAALAKIAVAPSSNGFIELAGPEPLRLADLGRRVLEARGDSRSVVVDATTGYFGGTVTDESLMPGHNSTITTQLRGSTEFANWLAHSARD